MNESKNGQRLNQLSVNSVLVVSQPNADADKPSLTVNLIILPDIARKNEKVIIKK